MMSTCQIKGLMKNMKNAGRPGESLAEQKHADGHVTAAG
jgi:hypothetical protein